MSRRRLQRAACTVGAAMLSTALAAEVSWTIVPGERIGPVTPRTSEADLIELFGVENVVPESIYLAEGLCSPGTRVFPESRDELAITWRSEDRIGPATVRVLHPGSRWATLDGVRVGTTLKELEAIRGEAIVFSGFGWDYGGGAWWGASTDEGATGKIGLRLAPAPESSHPQVPRAEEIYGEREVRSDHPVIREMSILVVLITQSWSNPWQEVECPR